ncbi:MAG TPA: iron-sulfur cluster assembly scaffold protein [Candidatus Babeliales bacterium]|nr:iron-sulfur cluster assembly scaffold protein [Candidatus Babeliales bacterium]
MNLYKNELMDHYRYPRNRGKIADPDFVSDEHNPSCGDSVSISGQVCNGIVSAIAFEGAGCVISQAAASMITEYVLGKSVDEIAAISTQQMIDLVGMPLGPVRLKCALLSLHAVQQGLSRYKEGKSNA